VVVEAPASPVHWTLEVGEEVSEADYASHRASAGLLDEVLTNSAFARFQEAYFAFKEAVAKASEVSADKRPTVETYTAIRRTFDDLLTALRRFDDRTSHALSSRYGKDSAEFKNFKQALSLEFKTSFAYRFCYHLRNYSDHRGSSISNIRQSSSITPGGTPSQEFNVILDARTLLNNYDKWHSQVRKDLIQIDGEFSALSVAEELYQACGRAHCKNLLSQEAGITEACAKIRSIADRHRTQNENASPIFIRTNARDLANGKLEPFNVSPIRIELLDVVTAALREAHQVAQP